MSSDVRSALSTHSDSATAAQQIADGLAAASPKVVVFFHAPQHDGRKIADVLRARFPDAHLAGSSTCGEFAAQGYCKGGVSALALGADRVERAASVMVSVDGDVQRNVEEAVPALSSQLGCDLRELDPTRHVGLLLVDSSRMREEDVNEALGNVAPLLSFVGGSSGDEMQFKNTWVHTARESRVGGAVLLVMRLRSTFHVLKACNFEPAQAEFTVTRAEPSRRVLWELDGKPAAQVYAAALGIPVDELDARKRPLSPLALVIDGKPWLRSVIRGVEGGGLQLACRVHPGMRLRTTRHKDILEDTRESLRGAANALGQPVAAGLLFNCVGRRFELQGNQLEGAFHQLLSAFPHAGFHAHGESWLGHINHTLTGLLFS